MWFILLIVLLSVGLGMAVAFSGVVVLLYIFIRNAGIPNRLVNKKKTQLPPSEFSPGPEDAQLEGYVQFESMSSQEALPEEGPSSDPDTSDIRVGNPQSAQWRFCILKGNMFFRYEDHRRESTAEVVCLDGCEVALKQPHGQLSARDNGIVLSHTERHLFGSQKWLLSFLSGKDVEVWQQLLGQASVMHSDPAAFQKEELQIKEYFEPLSRKISDAKDPIACANAMLARFWWNGNKSNGLQKFVRKFIRAKLSKLNSDAFPKFMRSIIIEKVSVGPQIPLLKNYKLVGFSARGELKCDVDIEYEADLELWLSVHSNLQLPGTSIQLPAKVYIRVEKLSGKARAHMSPPPCQNMWLGFHKMPELGLFADTEIPHIEDFGANMPAKMNIAVSRFRTDLTTTLIGKMKDYILQESMVLPRMEEWPMPSWSDAPLGHEDETNDDYVLFSRAATPESDSDAYLLKGRSKFLDITAEGISLFNTRVWNNTEKKKTS